MVDRYSPQAIWGRELKYYRRRAGLTQAQLAELVHYSESLISGIEMGQLPAVPEFAEACDQALDTGGALLRLLDWRKGSSFPTGFDRFRELEAAAAFIREYEALVVPGLLQNEAYARAVLEAGRPDDRPDQIDQLIAARLQRQELLTRPDAPRLFVVLDEMVLRRSVGGPKVMREQLAHLLDLARLPRVTIQVIPFDVGAHAGLIGAFMLLSFTDRSDIAYSEDPASGHVSERQEEVTACTVAFEALRAHALPVTPSLDLIRSALEDHNGSD